MENKSSNNVPAQVERRTVSLRECDADYIEELLGLAAERSTTLTFAGECANMAYILHKARRVEAGAAQDGLREALAEAVEFIKRNFHCAVEANCRECDEEVRPLIAKAEAALRREGE